MPSRLRGLVFGSKRRTVGCLPYNSDGAALHSVASPAPNALAAAPRSARKLISHKDYAQGGNQRVLSLDAVEFLRRFLLHVLPRGFQRIRHYGLLANCCRQRKIDLCRALIVSVADGSKDASRTDSALAHARCPECRVGVMVTIEIFRPGCVAWLNTVATLDSS